jgi:hypothetical protein
MCIGSGTEGDYVEKMMQYICQILKTFHTRLTTCHLIFVDSIILIKGVLSIILLKFGKDEKFVLN